ncbi:hypothetical protein Acr_02g0014560 [Actinidia rufa]|uniref:Uncharacterized protein n=1 Tax=Actinidia rufa TaxID=165716 RepID=A0A7J0EAK6_9ERIC|nr:hypothetical protein Acr_02g0014560 [Actinidia rufa]
MPSYTLPHRIKLPSVLSPPTRQHQNTATRCPLLRLGSTATTPLLPCIPPSPDPFATLPRRSSLTFDRQPLRLPPALSSSSDSSVALHALLSRPLPSKSPTEAIVAMDLGWELRWGRGGGAATLLKWWLRCIRASRSLTHISSLGFHIAIKGWWRSQKAIVAMELGGGEGFEWIGMGVAVGRRRMLRCSNGG